MLARKIGFLNDNPQLPPLGTGFGKDAILKFDSGREISLPDLTHHLLCLGTTGAGKSASVIFPGIFRLMEKDAVGMMLDLKGTMRGPIRALARACGREKDILELGTSPDAMPLNLFDGMDRHALRAFLELLASNNIKNSTNNFDWHLKGIAQAADCGQLLEWLAAYSPKFTKSPALIMEMLHSPQDAQALYAYFLNNIYDESNLEHRRFTEIITNNRFHLLRKDKKETCSGSSTIEEQLSWSLQGIRDALRNFLAAPGVESNFCRPGAPGLDLHEAMNSGKIIILRFEPETGPIAAYLARLILSHFYACALEPSRKLPGARPAFVCIDEFQEVADFSAERYSDSSFIALAREFNCAFMAATQSLSSLMARASRPEAAASFVSNCNQKILFYNDDPLTQQLADRHDPSVSLSTLKPGQAFVARYDSRSRIHSCGLETLNMAYESVRAITCAADVESRLPEKAAQKPRKAQSLFELAESLDQAKGRRSGIGGKSAKNGKPCAIPQDGRLYANANGRRLLKKFPALFRDVENVSINIPNGWLKFTEKALTAFTATGIEVRVSSLQMQDRRLYAEMERNSSQANEAGLKLLNKFLSDSSSYCVVCGERISISSRKENKVSVYDEIYGLIHHYGVPMCANCQKKLGPLVEQED